MGEAGQTETWATTVISEAAAISPEEVARKRQEFIERVFGEDEWCVAGCKPNLLTRNLRGERGYHCDYRPLDNNRLEVVETFDSSERRTFFDNQGKILFVSYRCGPRDEPNLFLRVAHERRKTFNEEKGEYFVEVQNREVLVDLTRSDERAVCPCLPAFKGTISKRARGYLLREEIIYGVDGKLLSRQLRAEAGAKWPVTPVVDEIIAIHQELTGPAAGIFGKEESPKRRMRIVYGPGNPVQFLSISFSPEVPNELPIGEKV